jgi:hypothetical protein
VVASHLGSLGNHVLVFLYRSGFWKRRTSCDNITSHRSRGGAPPHILGVPMFKVNPLLEGTRVMLRRLKTTHLPYLGKRLWRTLPPSKWFNEVPTVDSRCSSVVPRQGLYDPMPTATAGNLTSFVPGLTLLHSTLPRTLTGGYPGVGLVLARSEVCLFPLLKQNP